MSFNHEQSCYYYINKNREYLTEFGTLEKFFSIDTKLVKEEAKKEIPEFLCIPCTIKTQVFRSGLNFHGHIIVDTQLNLFYSTTLGWTKDLYEASLFEYRIGAEGNLLNIIQSTDDTNSPIKILAWKIETDLDIAQFMIQQDPIWFTLTQLALLNF